MTPAIVLKNIAKTYPGTQALHPMDFEAHAGLVHGILGHNGAGKSTLMGLIAGSVIPDQGTFTIHGKEIPWGSPTHAKQAGIAMVHQELQLCETLSIADNVALGNEKSTMGWLDIHAIHTRVHQALDRVGLHVSLGTRVDDLSLAQKQLVEIAKALYQNASIVLLDEPTAALSSHEVDTLFHVIRRLCQQGVCILYVSHRLDEMIQLCDTLTVLRNGVKIATHPKQSITREILIAEIMGEQPTTSRPRSYPFLSQSRLSIRDLTWHDRIGPISIDLHAGEIIGLGGLMGSGQTQLLRLIFGAEQPTQGHIVLNDTVINDHRPKKMLALGMGFLTDDRKELGLLLNQTPDPNITLASLKDHIRDGLIRNHSEHSLVQRLIKQLNITTNSPYARVNTLSGGNQQKVIFARLLASKCNVFLLDEPTRGIDIKGRHEIYQLMQQIAQDGGTVLFASSDMQELLEVSHRIGIMKQGRLTDVVDAKGLTQQQLTALMQTGADRCVRPD